ncbi:hypothetical protein ACSSTN_07035 [Pantoea agglomerans]|uniref:hypothetical protein n=1 Tax=Enterobacter agglomerans TaxID=549 RepID=UPI003ED981BD
MLKREAISSVKINQFFTDISEEYGYKTEKYFDELLELIDKWENQQFVEIYDMKSDRLHGRVKESDNDGQNRLIVEYLGICHARLRPNFNDPLIVIKFTEDSVGTKYVSIRFITDHDKLFGEFAIKGNRSSLDALRKSVDANVRRGDGHD